MSRLCGEMGEYKNQTLLQMPLWWKTAREDRRFCFDPCIQDELLELIYVYKIRTINSCCGHGNSELTCVIVAEYDINRMLELGYKQYNSICGEFRPDVFHLKYKPSCVI